MRTRPAMIVMVGSSILVGACADDVVCPSAGAFALTAPDGFAELTAGGSVTIRWRADGDPGASVRLRAIATDGVADVALAPANLEDGMVTWDGRDGGVRVPAANYRLGGDVARVGGCGGAAIVPDDLHLIVVQGVRLPTAPLTFTGSQASRLVAVTTVTRSMVPLALALDPDPLVDGDELEFAAADIPGEFTPTARSYPFSGLTTSGAAIPAGAYELVATFAGARTIGPRLSWAPAQ
ncbi:MAG: hypothetical protein IPL61_34575 [Myxococcales bacterium]|nr:hypothetical protein [Myxococcales bacterium]